MKRKLESIGTFKSTIISPLSMSKIYGGSASAETGAGSKNITDSCGNVVCVSHWTSDCNNGAGPNGVDNIDYYGITATYP